MSTIIPQGDSIRKAIKWISDHLQKDENPNLSGLINEASMRFDLTPNEGSFLVNFYKEQQGKQDEQS